MDTFFELEVGIVYSGEKKHFPALLSSLARAAGATRVRLILLDNASPDGITQWLPYYPHILPLRNLTRFSLPQNLNKILAAATAPYVLLMNADMHFPAEEANLARMVRFMKAYPRCGVSGCRQYRPDGEYIYPARTLPSLTTLAARRNIWPFLRLFSRASRRHVYLEKGTREVFFCDWLKGSYLMLRREAMQEIGPFDERFAHSFGDVDVCMRMQLKGWSAMFNGETYCYHAQASPRPSLVSRETWTQFRAFAHWFWKWRKMSVKKLHRHFETALENKMRIDRPHEQVSGLHAPPPREAAVKWQGPTLAVDKFLPAGEQVSPQSPASAPEPTIQWPDSKSL